MDYNRGKNLLKEQYIKHIHNCYDHYQVLINDDDEGDVPNQPDVDVLQIRSFGKVIIYWTNQESHGKESCETSHESVIEIPDVDLESKVGKQPDLCSFVKDHVKMAVWKPI